MNPRLAWFVRLSVMTGAASVLALALVMAAGSRTPASATWSATGSGSGSAATATLGPATALSAAQVGNAVDVAWTSAVAPSGGTLTGYYVTRYAGATPAKACGTDPALPATWLAGTATACTDLSLVNGTYTYTVTAVFRTWSVESAPSNALVVNIDGTAPGLALGTAAGPTGAFLSGTTLWYRSTSPGSVILTLAVTDGQSGPASATFPLVAAAGWTHAAETVTTGTGSAPTITYQSSPFSWTASPSNPAPMTVVGRDVVGNTSSIPVTFAADVSAPTGGALTVNGVAATAGGSQSQNITGAFALGPRVDYSADVGSGVASSVLTRQSAPFADGVCGSFGAPTTLIGTPAQSGLASGCYRYTLTGTDRVGNVSSIVSTVRVDATAPTQSLSLVAPNGAYLIPGRLYFKGSTAGSFQIAAAVTDGESGPAQSTFPAIATTGWTHNAETVTVGTGAPPTTTYTSSTFSWTAAPSVPATRNVVGADAAGNTVTSAVVFTRDNTAPAGGALRVNSTNASAAGTTSNNSTGGFTIATRTDYTEAQSATAAGLASSDLTRQNAPLAGAACGAFGAPVTLLGAPTESGLATGCYKYTLTGTDNVGNAVAISTTVRVDLSPPVGAALVVAGQAADTVTTTTSNGTGAWPIDVRTDWTDPEWAATTSTLTRQTAAIANGACGAFGASTTIVGTPAQSGTARSCYRYTLTGTNTAGLVSTISVIVKVDPYITGVHLLNGPGIAGRATAGDTIVVTFSGSMDSSSFCSAWGATGDQAINGDNQATVSLNNVAGSDTVTVTSSLCTFRFGTVSLGSTAYTAATTTFGGAGANKSTIAWNAAARTLTVALGAASSGSPATVATSTVTFTPNTSILNSSGLAMGGTFTTANIQQF